jgi:hypothetical protein
MKTYTFDFEATDRIRFPSLFGRVVVLVEEQESEEQTHRAAFNTAHEMVLSARGVEMVTALYDCI